MSTIIRDCFLLFNVVVVITAFSFILFYFCVPFCVVFILCLHCPWYGGSVSSRQQLIYILPVIKNIIPKAKKHISCSVSKLWKLISFLNLFFKLLSVTPAYVPFYGGPGFRSRLRHDFIFSACAAVTDELVVAKWL